MGRFGNNLFQYVFARLLGYYNKMKVVTLWNHSEFFKFTEMYCLEKRNNKFELIKIENITRDPDFFCLTPNKYVNKNIIVDGYFQFPDFYDNNKELIKSWIMLPEISEKHKEDVVIHLRLGDYNEDGRKFVIDPSWYFEIIKNMNVKKIYCVVEKLKHKWECEYINKLKNLVNLEPIVYREPSEDFKFIRQFGNIVCSNSTFAWWAAWLSNAKQIFTFQQWMNNPNPNLSNTKGFVPVSGKFFKS